MNKEESAAAPLLERVPVNWLALPRTIWPWRDDGCGATRRAIRSGWALVTCRAKDAVRRSLRDTVGRSMLQVGHWLPVVPKLQ